MPKSKKLTQSNKKKLIIKSSSTSSERKKKTKVNKKKQNITQRKKLLIIESSSPEEKEKIEEKFGKNITVTLIDDSKKKLELAQNAGFNIYHFKSRDQSFEQKLQSIAPKLNIN